ncbi:MAG: hypothetical protein UT41_C0007G0006 [Candidatus Wolfebacteria bacterium GW2011_GWC2_39_22]|uniref:Uncharacterized protein n=1 Tax=Candidatus Wolfebacteria bacterium GW2011_GWC2_39_22 TaxID=1619013 RepID=A0A0G0N8E8_9BACT|nr:MAG: hypothetical protein UT41_C0007G0006 [Candidatus Wolfebacteria bacterium GW2011_GWC2_39_22]
MNKHFAGIDPGLTGCIALIDNNAKILNVYDYPNNSRKLFQVYQRLNKIDGLTVCIENIMFMGKQSFSAQFRYLATYFEHIYLLNLFEIPYKIVNSQDWKKEFKLNKTKERLIRPENITDKEFKLIKDRKTRANKKEQKDLSFDIARSFFDNSDFVLFLRNEHHNRADALLMAEYSRRITK